MGALEDSILSSAPGGQTASFYCRFIDDIFGIWLHGEEALVGFVEHANAHHDDIRFTFECSRSVNILDVAVTIRGTGLPTDVHVKASNTHQYLLPTSNHPPHVHQHLPYGLGIRLCAIVSDQDVFEDRLQELAKFLVNRGYSAGLVEKAIGQGQVKTTTGGLGKCQKAC